MPGGKKYFTSLQLMAQLYLILDCIIGPIEIIEWKMVGESSYAKYRVSRN